MKLQHLYADRLNLQFRLGLASSSGEIFEYACCDDGEFELFPPGRDVDAFIEWNRELRPPDPRYAELAGRLPLLHERFPALDVYDEQIFDFLMLTINATLSVVRVQPYNAMNQRMKQYAFFRLARLPDPSALSRERRYALREFLFWFYLYAHPVNGETLEAFSFREAEAEHEPPTLVHTAAGVDARAYFAAYHDYYAESLEDCADRLTYTKKDIQACRTLTLQLLDALEGRSEAENVPMLPLRPEHPEWNEVIRWLNAPGELLNLYADDRTVLFETIHLLVSDPGQPAAAGKRSADDLYREHLAAMLLDDYVCCILHFAPDELLALIDYFEAEPAMLKQIVDRLFTDTIFLQKISRQHAIDWAARYPQVAALMSDKARRMVDFA